MEGIAVKIEARLENGMQILWLALTQIVQHQRQIVVRIACKRRFTDTAVGAVKMMRLRSQTGEMFFVIPPQ